MSEFREGSPGQVAVLEGMVDAGLLLLTGVHGIYARGQAFEQVRLGFDALVTRTAAFETPVPMLFPPIMPREQMERSGYLGSFPHLAGTVFGFEGDEAAAAEQAQAASSHGDWSAHQHQTDMVLTPAACYQLYPVIARRGPVPAGGLTLDTGDAYVFRREPSNDPARMQIFHMREIVRVGDRETVLQWRGGWRSRSEDLLKSLGLEIELEIANDPFFGRVGRLLAAQQRDQELKWELLAPIAADKQTAIASSNYHQDHMGVTYDLLLESGEPAHTSCMAFGEERVALALFAAHGYDLSQWPAELRQLLSIV
jgi:seryl-tRNA synthetase